MNIPMIDVAAQNEPLELELKKAFEKVLRSGRYILGPEVEAFEEELAAYTQVKHAIGVSSGTDALLVSLMALDIGPGDEVICPAFSFFATAGSVARLGATPVFTDICPECFNMDVESLESMITPKTKAIIPVHLFGQMANMTKIMEIANKKGIPVIEDGAQSLGASHNGKPANSFGTFGTTSFYPTKNLGAIGDAGMVFTNDSHLAEKVKMIRNHGAKKRYYHEILGGNFRLDEIQAAMLRIKFKNYQRMLSKRVEFSKSYIKAFEKNEKHSLIKCPVTHTENKHIWNVFTILLKNSEIRAELMEYLKANSIASDIYYPETLNRQKPFKSDQFYEVAEDISKKCLSLPIELANYQSLDYILSVVTSFNKN